MTVHDASNGIRITIEKNELDGKDYLLAVDDNGLTHATASEDGIAALSEFLSSDADLTIPQRNAIAAIRRDEGSAYRLCMPALIAWERELAHANECYFAPFDWNLLDAEPARWRYPSYTSMVVYPERGGLHWVLDESTGESKQRNGVHLSDGDRFHNAAHAYVKARGGRWVDAAVGEIWVITAKPVGDSIVAPFRVSVREELDGPRRVFEPTDHSYPVTHLGVRASCITDGRRIWPEAS